MTSVPEPAAAPAAAPGPGGPPAVPPPVLVSLLIGGYWNTQVVYVVARLGLADLVAAGGQDAGKLAAATGADPDALRRLLRAACGLGLFAAGPGGAYRLTPLGECLRTDSPQSVRHTAVLAGGMQYRVWAELLDSVRTGAPGFERALGQPLFPYLAGHPEEAGTLHRAMAEFARTAHLPALAGYDFSRTGTVVDVGGGTGVVLRHLLEAYPRLRGILFDQPDTLALAVPELRDGPLAARCRLVAGDFFQQLPVGGDTYLVAMVLHDLPDEAATRLLAGIRAVIPPAGALVALEIVLPEGAEPGPRPIGALSDLNMLVSTGGRERTAAELERLLAGAGFRLDRIVRSSPGPFGAVVAAPA